ILVPFGPRGVPGIKSAALDQDQTGTRGYSCRVNVFLPRLRSFLRRLLVLIIASSAPMAANAEPVRSSLRALILSGSEDQARRAKSTLLRELLESTGRFEVRVCETPVGLTAATFTPFDVIIDDLSAEQLGEATEKAIESFVKSDKGYVVLHDRLFKFASGKATAWPGFAAMTKLQGPTNQVAETEPLKLFSIKFAQPEHPIIAGLKDAQKTADRIGNFSVKSAA